MTTSTYPTDLTDRQWHCIRDLIPAAKRRGRPRLLEMRQVVNALLYLLVGGIAWRLRPESTHPGRACITTLADGATTARGDAFASGCGHVRQKAGRHKHTAGAHSQSVKTTQVAGVRGYDSGKQIKRGTCWSILWVWCWQSTAASVSDPAGARLLFRRLSGSCKKLRRIWVDGTYRGQLLVWVVAHFQFVLTPVLRKESRKALCSRIVERTFAWLSASVQRL